MHEKYWKQGILKNYIALSPNWGPPPIWADFLEEYQHVNFGKHFKLIWKGSSEQFFYILTRICNITFKMRVTNDHLFPIFHRKL